MNTNTQIPLRLKYLFLFATILVFSLITGIAFLHLENTVAGFREAENEFESTFRTVPVIDGLVSRQAFSLSQPEALVNQPAGFELQDSLFAEFLDRLDEVRTDLSIFDDAAIVTAVEEISALAHEWNEAVKSFRQETEPGAAYWKDFLSLHNYVDELMGMKAGTLQLIENEVDIRQERMKLNLVIVTGISILIVMLVLVVIAFSSDRSLRKILTFTRILEEGSMPAELFLNTGDEYQEIARRLNNYLDHQREKHRFLQSIGKGGNSTSFVPGKNDLLGNEMVVLADRLEQLKKEEEERMAIESRRRWISVGIAQFAELLRSERENMQELSFLIVQKLVTYLGIEMGMLYISYTDDEGTDMLESIATYAYDRRKYQQVCYTFGEGLPGTCAIEKARIFIDEIPEDYSDIISGVGQSKPRYVLLVPLKIEEVIFGVLEIASLKKLEDHDLELVEQLSDSIASTLAAVKSNEKTSQLLQQSRDQAELLMKQDEEMRKNLRALEETQEESKKRETEITGIINAMNHSSLVAEFGTSGRFININERFTELLESPQDQIMGKHHSEFAVVDRYSDEYKSLWSSLKQGETVSRQDKYRLFSGKEIWLQQTFTPIFHNENRVYKILNIAIDITRSKLQQQNLEKQANEITRKNLEMKSLNEAVNAAIIKCELNESGNIIELNPNFAEATGYSRKELIGRNYRLFLKDIEKEQFDRIWAELLKDKTYEGAIRRTKPTGEEVWLMASFSPVKDESGDIYKIYFLGLDITEKKLKYQLLEEANREVDRLKEIVRKYEG